MGIHNIMAMHLTISSGKYNPLTKTTSTFLYLGVPGTNIYPHWVLCWFLFLKAIDTACQRCRSSSPKKISLAVPLQDNPVLFHCLLLCRLATFRDIFQSSLLLLAILTSPLGLLLSSLYQLQINL